MTGRLLRLAEAAVRAFFADNCPKYAAAISYHVLFSMFPLAILVVAVSGLLLRRAELRADVVGELVSLLPLSPEGEADIRRLLEGVADARNALGFLAVAGFLWAASGMMAAIRTGLNQAWGGHDPRPPLQGKLLDVALVLVAGLLAVASVAVTFAVRLARDLLERAAGVLGLETVAATGVGIVASLLIAFCGAAFLYRIVPSARPPWRHVAVGAAVAAAGFELIKQLFALYLEHFGSYNAVYGSLGAVMAFLAFVYLSANVFLLGAEVAAAWPRSAAAGDEEPEPIGRRLLGFVRGLAFRPSEPDDRSADRRSPRARSG
jgi:membrane protein